MDATTSDSGSHVGRNAILLLPIGYVVYYIGSAIYNIFFSPYAKVPGPFLAKFTRFWELRILWGGGYIEKMIDLHAQYGPVVRLAPNRFSFDTPEAQRAVYAIGAGMNKASFYEGSGDPNRMNLFNMTDEKEHSIRKRKVAQLYTMSTMVNYEEPMDKMMKVFLKKFTDFSKQGKWVNIPDFCQYFSFDVIGEITFDRNFSLMESESDTTGILSVVSTVQVYLCAMGLFPEWHPLVFKATKMLKIQPPNVVINRMIGEQVQKAAARGLEEKENAKAQGFLKKCLDLESHNKLDKNGIYDACGSNIVAGSDSTSAALSGIIFRLYHNPRVLQKLRDEIQEQTAKGLYSNPPTFTETQNMPYLQSVISEGLRMFPPVAHLLPRRVPDGPGLELHGYHFPPGSELGVNAWPLHYNPKYIDKPTEFRPERWLDQSSLTTEQRMGMSFAFGGGSRSCIGKNISLLEMSKFIPYFAQHFDLEFETADPLKTTDYFFFVHSSYLCRVKTRMNEA